MVRVLRVEGLISVEGGSVVARLKLWVVVWLAV
jgi:hypothetical protein